MYMFIHVYSFLSLFYCERYSLNILNVAADLSISPFTSFNFLFILNKLLYTCMYLPLFIFLLNLDICHWDISPTNSNDVL